MATSPSAASLLIRLDPAPAGQACSSRSTRASGGRSSTGSSRPGTRLPSSRALAADLGVSRTTTLLAVQQLLAEGYLTARRGSGTFVADELPDDLAGRAAPAARRPDPSIPTLSRAGRARWPRPAGRAPARGPAAGLPHRHARRGPVPGRPLVAARAAAALRVGHARPSSTTATRRACAPCARRSPSHVQTARGHALRRRAGARRGRRPAGPRAGLPPAARSGRPRVDGGAGLSRARAARCSGAGARIVPVPVDAEGLDVAGGRPAAPATPGSPTSRRRTSSRSACR